MPSGQIGALQNLWKEGKAIERNFKVINPFRGDFKVRRPKRQL